MQRSFQGHLCKFVAHFLHVYIKSVHLSALQGNFKIFCDECSFCQLLNTSIFLICFLIEKCFLPDQLHQIQVERDSILLQTDRGMRFGRIQSLPTILLYLDAPCTAFPIKLLRSHESLYLCTISKRKNKIDSNNCVLVFKLTSPSQQHIFYSY